MFPTRQHRPVLDRSPDAPGRVCAICDQAVTGPDNALMHLGETRAIKVVPHRDDARTFSLATEEATKALSTLTERASDEERGRLVIEALYAQGLIPRRKRRMALEALTA